MYELNHVKWGIETFQKTVICEIRDKWNRDKRGLPVSFVSVLPLKGGQKSQNVKLKKPKCQTEKAKGV